MKKFNLFKIKITKKGVIIAVTILIAVFLGAYFVGYLAQLLNNYHRWMNEGGLTSNTTIQSATWNIGDCFRNLFTRSGMLILFGIIAISVGIFFYIKYRDKINGREKDPRGFIASKSGIHGSATWMGEKELKSVLHKSSPEDADGIILGEYKGEVISLPPDTGLNKNIAIVGSPGTMKSRAIIRNALLQALKQNESVIVTDPKGEMYADMAELYRKNGYDVKVFNLIDPAHSDGWNCMADLKGDSLLAQTLTNVIIGNTSAGKGDQFWDNGEANLLKALVLYVDQSKSIEPEDKNLATVYRLLTDCGERGLNELFRLPSDHPARAPYQLFAQSSETVKSGIVLGLGTRLQVLQNRAVQRITSKSEIELTAPAKRKCAYFIMISDQDTTMAFLSSLFFSFLFIKLTRYADSCKDRKCPVPVDLILDEFNNVGRIGGAMDGSDFARSLSVCRSREIRVMLAVQSLGQLRNRYPNDLWSEIIGNCDTLLMLGCTDSVTAEFVSERSGDMSVKYDSIMSNRKTFAPVQVIPEYRLQEGECKRRLLTPDEVLRLPNQELLCIIRGYNILRLKKWDYTNHPLAAQIIKTSVHDYLPNGEREVMRSEDDAQSERVKDNNSNGMVIYRLDDFDGSF
ncbi:MAG: type IV secretory system conjugative DNA transfer family protein [Ruminococcus flavefaciens]|nr:type IV secretory system conjugative DNA transfer family protein [Ruminococcus flavefaciens]